ncbi:MAG TPA: HAMP domain-containing sensor histidine kinase [Polyangia bacterium]
MSTAAKTAPAAAPLDEELARIRGRLADTCIIFGATFGLPLLCASLFMDLRVPGRVFKPVLDTLLYLGFVALALARHRISFRARALGIVVGAYVGGLGNLVTQGILGPAGFFVLTAVAATLFLGGRAGMIALGACVLSLAAVGLAVHLGVARFGFDANALVHSSAAWLDYVATYTFVLLILVLAITTLQRKIAEQAAAAQRRGQNLAEANLQLQREVGERARVEWSLRTIVEGTAAATGGDFLRSLVAHLARALGCAHAFIGELAPGGGIVRPLAMCSRGELVAAAEYSVEGTPCADVLAHGPLLVPRDAQRRYPEDPLLVPLGIQAYAGAPLRNSAGEVIGLIALLSEAPLDESRRTLETVEVFAARAAAEVARMRAETSLARHQRDLERTVRERTEELELTHAKLVERERLATLGRLTASVSHELRNPLAVVNLALDVLRGRCDRGPEVDRALARASRGVARCDAIIADLMAYTRAGTRTREPTELDPWLAGIVAEIAPPQEVALHPVLESHATVAIDREALERCVINLVQNAVEAMSDGRQPHELEVATGSRDRTVWIRVADNGPGMAPEVRARACEPLFTTKKLGFGLGLAIVKQVAEAHGGGLEIDSAPGVGTAITIRLEGETRV